MQRVVPSLPRASFSYWCWLIEGLAIVFPPPAMVLMTYEHLLPVYICWGNLHPAPAGCVKDGPSAADPWIATAAVLRLMSYNPEDILALLLLSEWVQFAHTPRRNQTVGCLA